jgi:CIC family chloride channel protein
MIFEMTQDYAVIVPLMIANMISLFIASKLQHEPIYEALAVQDGIHLPAGPRQRDGQHSVANVMQRANQLLPAETTVQQALERAKSSKIQTWLITDQQGVVGVINLPRLEQEIDEGAQKQLGDLIDSLTFPHVHSDQGLDLALERMGTNQIEILPVVSRADVHKLEGIVTLRDILTAYGVPQPLQI